MAPFLAMGPKSKYLLRLFQKNLVFPEYLNFIEEARDLQKISDEIHPNSFLNYVAIWYEAIAQALNPFKNLSFRLDTEIYI